jgi:uncharacterized membrane protein
MTEAPSEKPKAKHSLPTFVQNTVLAGLLTAIPLIVTWFVLAFLFRLTASAGRPVIEFVAHHGLAPLYPGTAHVLLQPAISSALAVLVVALVLFALGLLTRQVIGRRLVALMNRIIEGIPFANKLYKATRQFVEALQRGPDGTQRVVLIDFPSPEMKAVGIVTRTMIDTDTGEEIAAVFVPTTPNPTAGYLEVVPVSKLTTLRMSMDDAISFVVSGGAVGPNTVNYRKSAHLAGGLGPGEGPPAPR